MGKVPIKKQVNHKCLDDTMDFISRYLDSVDSFEIVHYIEMAMHFIDRITTEEQFIKIVYKYYLYYHGESKFLPFADIAVYTPKFSKKSFEIGF